MSRAKGRDPESTRVEQRCARRRLSAEQKQALGSLRTHGHHVAAGALRQAWHDGREVQIHEQVLCEHLQALISVGNQVVQSSQMVWADMTNRAMQRKLYAGQATDLSGHERTEDGSYRLEVFRCGIDYCNAEMETWIYSIGRHKETGEILASHTGVYREHPAFDCLFLRKGCAGKEEAA